MDFIRQNGLIIDFTDGYVVCAQHANAKPFYMPVNVKGHFMVNLVEYLCEGKTLHDGHPSLHVTVPEGEGFEGRLSADAHMSSMELVDDVGNISTLEFECGTVVTSDVNSLHSHRTLFEQLWQRRLRLQQEDRLMGGVIPTSFHSRRRRFSRISPERSVPTHGIHAARAGHATTVTSRARLKETSGRSGFTVRSVHFE